MKNFVKYAAVGVAGYLVGFYEMKYKANQALLDALMKYVKENAQK